MKRPVIRVVCDNLPYLIVPGEDGPLERAYGPFAPGTEPSLAQAGQHNEVRDPDTLHALSKLVPISPTVPPPRDTLAGQD